MLMGSAAPICVMVPIDVRVLIFILFALPWIGGKLGIDLNVLGWLVGIPAQFLTDLIATVTGLK